ncbi:hypothetical protein ACFO9Q_10795 [Paenibacillus sp. GCM10023252]|uniref:hypothetical protein n=1 Tax=Paenibacillus sp. GCM10023252 TaxID=3252649 RepID=UPI003611A9E5
MIQDEQLEHYRQSGERVRIVRDAIELNDVMGIVVAWDEKHVAIRRMNKRVVKVSRAHHMEAATDPRGSYIE